uniref:Uncharacterized protein n=1 Tax=Strongyloides papillosus TaxID=174720 RepID=A0A0N5CEX9_STREA
MKKANISSTLITFICVLVGMILEDGTEAGETDMVEAGEVDMDMEIMVFVLTLDWVLDLENRFIKSYFLYFLII